MGSKRAFDKQTLERNVPYPQPTETLITQHEAIHYLQSMPRKVIALVWALSTIHAARLDGATYRALEAMLGTRKRATLRDTVTIAEVAHLVEVHSIPGKRSIIKLTEYGFAIVKRVLNVKPTEKDKE